MNFWKRYPADYQRKTARLTLAQHGAYTLLLDELYTAESPLPAEMGELFRICRAMSKPEQEAVRLVAERFFPVGAGGSRHNKRAAEELEEAAPAVAAARANGKLGGRPKKPKQEPKGNPMGSENKTQNEPRSKAPHSSESSSIEELPPSGVQGAKASRRCPSDFEPAVMAIVSMQNECPGVDLEREMRKFRDWEFQKPRKDWPAAWRTWMRKAFDDLKARPTGETNYAKTMREKYEVVAPRVAALAPGVVRENPMDVIEGMSRELRLAS